MQLTIKVSYKLISTLSGSIFPTKGNILLMSMVKHSQSTQSNKFAISQLPFSRGCSFYIKNLFESEIFNDRKSL